MLIHLKAFIGKTLNDSNYRATLLNPHGSTSARPVYIEQAQADSQDSGTYTVATQVKIVRIQVLNPGNRHALIAQLKTWFKRGTRGDLVGTFSDDGVDYQLTCRVINLIQDPDYPMYFTAVLETGQSAWRAVNLTTETTWVVTGTSETQDIAVGGKDETFLSLSLTPTGGPASGYLYQDLYRLPNTPGIEHGLIGWCITVNTAALVTAGKMQADCDDLRIIDLNTGEELKRWIINPNTTTTKVWINLDLKLGFALTLTGNVPASGSVPYLQFGVNATNKALIAKMPKTGIVYHNNEWFAYSSTDSKNCRLYLSTRKLFGTTEEAHTAGAVFNYIQYPLLMKYGNASVSSPASEDANYDDTKPLINLTSSTNTSWVWDASALFYDPDHPNRTCGWKFGLKAKGPNSKVFYVKQDAESGDPALGLKVASYLVGSIWNSETVTITATFFRAAMITTSSMTGDKYRSNVNWIGLAALRRSKDNVTFYNLWTEPTPASAGAWAAWTHNSVAVAAGTKYLQLILSGGYKGAADAYAVLEALTGTADFNSANIPTGAFLGETNAYPMLLTIANNANGDAISLDFITLISKPFVIDGELRTAQYDGVNAHSAMTLNDESRSSFLRLVGGQTNTIQISGPDLGTLSVVMSYYKRRL